MQASPHFSFSELTHTGTGLPNDPDPDAGANLVRLADTLLEPLRVMAGGPVRINSGYRCQEVNRAVGGAALSAHLDGRAADLVPTQASLGELFERVRRSGLPYDQLILEPSWIHIAVARLHETPRRQALVAHREGGRMRYQEVSRG